MARGAATNAFFDITTGSQLNLNNNIYTNTGFTKIGNGRLVLNAQQTSENLVGDTGRNAGYTLLGQIKVNAGELWLTGNNNRSAGATGAGNEIIVASGATLDIRGSNMSYGDDPDAARKIIQVQGIGFAQPFGAGTLTNGALRNTSGTAQLPNVQVMGTSRSARVVSSTVLALTCSPTTSMPARVPRWAAL